MRLRPSAVVNKNCLLALDKLGVTGSSPVPPISLSPARSENRTARIRAARCP